MTDKNSQRYAPPEGYYDRTSYRPVSDFLKIALDRIDDAHGMTALDFGCGAGNQSKYILEKGYSVTAVDGNKAAGVYIAKLAAKGADISFIQSDFEQFRFGSYDLVHSLHALSFTHKDAFVDMFTRLKASLKPNGIFAGQFYGVNDEWNKPGETMTFLSREQVESLLEDMQIVSFVERDEMGTIADNTPKHWHVFDVVAVKPQ